MQAITDEAVCPSCGAYGFVLEDTGWCLSCTRDKDPDLCICQSCGLTFSGRGQLRTTCQRCDRLTWWKTHADKIELYMAAGLTAELAIIRIKSVDARPLCLACGRRIKGGTRGRHFFCRSTKVCRSAARRYKLLRESHAMSKVDALNKVVEELKVVKQ